MLIPVFLTSCGGGSTTQLRIANRYVIAYTPISSSSHPETRFSDDGITWSSPIIPRDITGNLVKAKVVPSGIGANADQYLLAWFDPGSKLHTAISSDGTSWSHLASHGQFSVDIGSRPAVEFNYQTRTWFVAFKTTSNNFVVIPVSGPGGKPVSISGVSSNYAPGLVWLIDHLILIFNDGSNQLRSLSSDDGIIWPAGPGNLLTSAGAPILAEHSPYLNRSILGLWLATERSSSTGTLTSGNIRIYSYNAGDWEYKSTLIRTDPNSRGPAIAGTGTSNLTVLDTGRTGTTIWRNGQEIGPLDTRTQYEVSMAYGPQMPTALPIYRCGPCNICKSYVAATADYYRSCTDQSGLSHEFMCMICGPCISGHWWCSPTQYGSDAPGYPDEIRRQETCKLCGR